MNKLHMEGSCWCCGACETFFCACNCYWRSVSSDYPAVYEKGIDAVFSITTRPMTLEEAYRVAEENIEMTTKNIAAVWKIASEKHF